MAHPPNNNNSKPATTPNSPILWQNSDRTVTLLDIPHSIVCAQNHLDGPSHLHLVSSAPLLVPFPTNEPKSAAARAKLEGNSGDREVHAELRAVIERALQEVKCNYDGPWCLPRPFVEETPRAAKKRRLESDAEGISLNSLSSSSHPTNGVQHGTPSTLLHEDTDGNYDYPPWPGTSTHPPNPANPTTTSFTNSTPHTTPLKLHPTSPTYLIPPHSSFHLTSISNPQPLHARILHSAQTQSTRKTLDFILLDPPWPNRSVKRTHQTPGSTYATAPSLSATRDLILNADLDVLMAEECLVGMWITNKPAVREAVLGEEEGVFACWGVELVEEWVWVKTTVAGEPVTPVAGVWRRPYEVLLLGRKGRGGGDAGAGAEPGGGGVKRRVILGVPDLHSRKPCLKALIEPFMRDREDYRALEVFARHLVAGWWSWGDECVKFNWEGFWRGGGETAIRAAGTSMQT